MELQLTFADKIDPVAIYAAVVATFVLVWDVVKWIRVGPRLTGYASPNMRIFSAMETDDNLYVFFQVSNNGTAKTTITNVGLVGYASPMAWIRAKPTRAGFVNHSELSYPLPYVLDAGERFTSKVLQDELENFANDYRVYGVINHTFGRPLYLRIKLEGLFER